MISIISGKWKGHKLKVPRTKDIRPTAAKVRGSIFDALEALYKKEGKQSPGFSTVLDLYAGSGALGFEALSRGAKSCIFVEKSPICQEVLEWNRWKLICEKESTLVKSSVEKSFSFWRKLGPYDLILVDPPYAQNISHTFQLLLSSGILAKGGVIVLEHSSKQVLGVEDSGFELYFQRTIGVATISMYRSRA